MRARACAWRRVHVCLCMYVVAYVYVCVCGCVRVCVRVCVYVCAAAQSCLPSTAHAYASRRSESISRTTGAVQLYRLGTKTSKRCALLGRKPSCTPLARGDAARGSACLARLPGLRSQRHQEIPRRICLPAISRSLAHAVCLAAVLSASYRPRVSTQHSFSTHFCRHLSRSARAFVRRSLRTTFFCFLKHASSWTFTSLQLPSIRSM